jgi:hypothetical protein
MINPMIKLLLTVVAVYLEEMTWTEKELPPVGSKAPNQLLHGMRIGRQWERRQMVLPLSPVHEDPTSPQVPGSAQETAGAAKPVVLSPAIKRMVIPEIPSFDSLQKKKQAPDVLSNKTNGIFIPQIPQFKAPTPAVPAPQQSVWHTQNKKKPKKAADATGRSPVVNGHASESLPEELAERKGG